MKIQMVKTGKIVVDGRSFVGDNLVIHNGKVIVDGVTQSGTLYGLVTVVVHGDVESIDAGSGDVKCVNVGEVTTGSGDVDCADVSGSIRTGSGDVSCNNVKGHVRTGSGDVYKK